MKQKPKHNAEKKPKGATPWWPFARHTAPPTESRPLKEGKKRVPFVPKTENKQLLAIWSVLYLLRPRFIYPSDHISILSFIKCTTFRLLILCFCVMCVCIIRTIHFSVENSLAFILLLSFMLCLLYWVWFPPEPLDLWDMQKLQTKERVPFVPKMENKQVLAIWSVLYLLRPRFIYPNDYISILSFINFTAIRLFFLILCAVCLEIIQMIGFSYKNSLPLILAFSLLLTLFYVAWIMPEVPKWMRHKRNEFYDRNGLLIRFTVTKPSPKEAKIQKLILILVSSPLLLFKLFMFSLFGIVVTCQVIKLFIWLLTGHSWADFTVPE